MNVRYALHHLSPILVAAVLAAAPASADAAPQVRISYSDLNLATPAGIATLYGRIRHAAEVVCGPAPLVKDLNQRPAWTKCTTTAVDDAIAATHLPALSALHERQTGVPVATLADRR